MSLREKRLDPRVKRTRQLLEQSFVELLIEKDFQSITVQDIAQRATINRATFYAHFDDKFALLAYVIRQSFQKILQGNLPPDSDFSLDNLKILILAVCNYLKQFNHQLCKASDAQYEPLIEKELQSQIYHFVLRWVTQLQVDKPNLSTAPEVIASAISWTIFGAGLSWSRGDNKNSAEDISNHVLSLITEGLNGSFSPKMPYLKQSVG